REPWEVENKTGGPFKVFTPFWRACQAMGHPTALAPRPKSLPRGSNLTGVTLESLALLPRKPDWSGGMQATWKPGEAGAVERLSRFIEAGARGYAVERDRPDLPSTSALSPHLRFGEISPRQIIAAIAAQRDGGVLGERDADKFIAEIGWREFSYHLLFHAEDLTRINIQRRFDGFPWSPTPAAFAAWSQGLTGYPIVDAGMRQLWQTGWMHNRVRMIVASFLIKHLLIDWREGEAWFWDTLVDADPANNAASWQWVAGSGADAAPYFRIFNPV
ncbi:MAG: cryptochrome/photolyase family protein, partial [Hyphomicrobiales bacterium]